MEIEEELNKLDKQMTIKAYMNLSVEGINELERRITTLNSDFKLYVNDSDEYDKKYKKRLELLINELEVRKDYFNEIIFLESKKKILKSKMNEKYLLKKPKGSELEKKETNTRKDDVEKIVNLCNEILNDYNRFSSNKDDFNKIQIKEEEAESSFVFIDLTYYNPVSLINNYILDIHQIKFECEKYCQNQSHFQIADLEMRIGKVKKDFEALKGKYKVLEEKYKKIHK